MSGSVGAKLEVQNLRAVFDTLLLKPAERAVDSITEMFTLCAAELALHRTFEAKLRDGTVTEEFLQQHLDSLVAFRRETAEILSQKSQAETASRTYTSTKDTFTR